MPEASPLLFLALLASGLLTGGLIGSVGVGGVLLAPLLALLAGFDLHSAMATSSFSFIFTGMVGTVAYARRGSVQWRSVAWLAGPVVPAALLGARTNSLLPTSSLVLILAALLTWSGLRALLSRRSTVAKRGPQLPGPLLLVVGAVAGFGSALTGTGGPVMLLPMLLLLKLPALTAIGISQVVQLPVALFSTVGFFLHGQLNVTAGILLGVTQAAGVLVGARLAHALPNRLLSNLVAYMLLVVAAVLMFGPQP
jgi:uncharacterized membrane protein YfcA